MEIYTYKGISDGKYVEGAEPGKIINTVTNELFDKISVYLVITKDNTSNGKTEVPAAVHRLQFMMQAVI